MKKRLLKTYEAPHRFLRNLDVGAFSSKMKKRLRRTGTFYVYIVKCRKGTYYTGYTTSLEDRMALHNRGHGAKYLKGRGPVELVYAKEYRYYKNALRAERNLKKLTRKQKDDVIRMYGKNG